ncbi:RNA polymerase sporulation sigma factor SigH [Bacillus sp. EB600]|uniref:RNA polymerase sporulation sigma factor SigH n=1 Tax=Bacillus sp. EB600 TaxID=2806345 RepID=UPI00210EC485|nr:RNA polymerase sporulation sigma factor SigH [Bacillus sp. EB600]MCQ6279668.1 RNA polymerase sporulation sigma factor SigH [Bacillus sp. EB600]
MSVNTKVKMTENYGNLDDEILVDLVHNGDVESLNFLFQKYQNLVRGKARRYFLVGADREDIIQEGMIGLYKAIRDFKKEKMTAFKAFAEHCIYRQIVTAIKKSSRKKHSPLNSYISLDKPIFNDESNATLIDVMPEEKITNPEAILINQESVVDIERKIAKLLSGLEQRVLALYIDGQSYIEISEELNTSPKTIDNALQRAKRKLSVDTPKLDVDKEKKTIYFRKFT